MVYECLSDFRRRKYRVFLFKKSSIIILMLLIFLIVVKNKSKKQEELDALNNGSDEYFNTAMGTINIAEIEENVFEKFGYELIKNDLIPVLKKRNSQTCQNIFYEWHQVAGKGLTVNPPKEIPDPKDIFLLNGYARESKWYFDETPNNEEEAIKIWNNTYINELVNAVKQNPLSINPSYDDQSLAVFVATKHYDINGQIGAVIGSQSPWVEAYLLVNGAGYITTVDYHKILIQHSQIDFLYVLDLVSQSKKYYNKFDFIVSFSSIEHSGLGRYGDPIDPIGDLREMMKIRCMLKPGGLLFLGIPVGADAIVYNAHRIYGRIRLGMMFEGFRVLNVFSSETILQDQTIRHTLRHLKQPPIHFLFVLKKVE